MSLLKRLLRGQIVSLSFAIAVFITCHSVRWIPNLYELQQKEVGSVSLKLLFVLVAFSTELHSGRPEVAAMDPVLHPPVTPAHCSQHLDLILHLLDEALQRKHSSGRPRPHNHMLRSELGGLEAAIRDRDSKSPAFVSCRSVFRVHMVNNFPFFSRIRT